MRILFVATALDRPEAYLLSGLASRGFELRLLISEDSAPLAVLDRQRITIEKIGLRSRVDFPSIGKIRTVLKEFRPDVIHSLSARALSNSLFASIGFSCKQVAYRGTMGNLSYWDPSSLISFLHPKLNKIICVSDAVLHDLARIGVSSQKLVRIYKGHSQSWYSNVQPLPRESFGASDSQYVITCVANSRPVKGVDTLLRAFLKIPRDISAQLLIVGEIRDQTLMQLAALDSRISLLGFRSDAPSIVASSDLFCMPSRRREGFPKALLEAMIQGVPAVVTDVGGLPEMVIDRHNGLVVPADDEDKLAAALTEFIGNIPFTKSCGENARERVLTKFTIDTTIESTAAVYHELVAVL